MWCNTLTQMDHGPPIYPPDIVWPFFWPGPEEWKDKNED